MFSKRLNTHKETIAYYVIILLCSPAGVVSAAVVCVPSSPPLFAETLATAELPPPPVASCDCHVTGGCVYIVHSNNAIDMQVANTEVSMTKGRYIGMARVGQHCSHTFGKSAFPW